jgi:hypothetical protein
MTKWALRDAGVLSLMYVGVRDVDPDCLDNRKPAVGSPSHGAHIPRPPILHSSAKNMECLPTPVTAYHPMRSRDRQVHIILHHISPLARKVRTTLPTVIRKYRARVRGLLLET